MYSTEIWECVGFFNIVIFQTNGYTTKTMVCNIVIIKVIKSKRLIIGVLWGNVQHIVRRRRDRPLFGYCAYGLVKVSV